MSANTQQGAIAKLSKNIGKGFISQKGASGVYFRKGIGFMSVGAARATVISVDLGFGAIKIP